MKFKKLKIKIKLMICFIIISLFTGLVGTLGIINMNTLNKRSEEMYLSNLLPLQDIATIQKNALSARSYVLMIVYDRDTSLLQERIDKISSFAAENNEAYARIENSLDTEDEKNTYDTLKSNNAAYRLIRDETIELVKQGKYEEAQIKLTEVDAAKNKVDEGIKTLVKINTDFADNTYNTNKDDFQSNSIVMIIIISISMGIAILFGLIIAAIISKPLSRLVYAANKIAEGDLTQEIYVDTKDEIGQLSKAFKLMLHNMNEALSNISEATQQVFSGAQQVSDSSIALSQGTTEQASSIEQLTASMEDISSQTKENAQNATKASELAEAAKNNAAIGNEQMSDMLKAMEEINVSSTNISRIIKVIDEIAFQTNILALNAAVEAARAGQQGKGFAVVAEEVRNLASRSANAAKETTGLIEGSMKKVEGGTKIAHDTAIALNNIVDDVTRVAGLVSNIAISSNEQSNGIAQVSQGILQVSDVVQTNSATSEESADK
ncbi:MAG: methyl-accepting chemotaxis sensory transducer [Herbinix sp.]|nr:methyl-accepting chemotaxis sensory transducer [Herbinix sp.]